MTIWPAIIAWLAVSGSAILWSLTITTVYALRDREKPDVRGALLFLSFLAMGIVFLGGAIGLLYAVLWRTFRH